MRQRAGILHLQLLALFYETGQEQLVQVEVGHLAQHGHAPLLGQAQEVGHHADHIVRYADMHQDGTVGNVKLGAFRITVLGAETGIQIIEQAVEGLQIGSLTIKVYALLVSLHTDGTLCGIRQRRNKERCLFHTIIDLRNGERPENKKILPTPFMI